VAAAPEAGGLGVEESPDSAGQDAGEIPDGATRGKCNRKQTARGLSSGKGETVR
jgi:hypothetical protein